MVEAHICIVNNALKIRVVGEYGVVEMMHQARDSSLPQPRHLIYGSISNNPITGWTPDVSRLRKMEKLLLSGVNLDQFPAGLQQLNKLQTLDLSENNISKLNSSASSLFKLKTLNLKGNKIKV